MNQGFIEEIDVQNYWLVLKRRWLIAAGVLLTFVGLSGVAIYMQKPEYEASGMLLFQSNRTSSLTKVGEKIGDLESVMREGNPLETQAVILNSEPIIQKVINTLKLKDKKGKLLNPELVKVKVETITGTDVLKISYSSKDPEVASSVVNQVMKTYVEKNIESNRSQVFAAGSFIKKQLPDSKAELEQAAEALRQFKNQFQIIELKDESTAAINNVAKIDEEMNQVKAAIAEAIAQETQLRSQLNIAQNQPVVEIASLNQIPGVQEVLSELQKAQTQLAVQRTRYTEDHPSITSLKNQEINLNNLLRSRIEQVLGPSGMNLVFGNRQTVSTGKLQIGQIKQNLASQLSQLQTQRQGLEKKILALSNIRDSYKQRLSILPNLEKKQGDLERTLSVAQKNYESLVNRSQEIQVAERQTVGNARVIQHARVPNKPTLSKSTLALAGGGVFGGLLFGVAVAFFIDLIDNSLKTVKEAEVLFDLTLLGLIPKFEPSPSTVPSIKGISPRIVIGTYPHTIVHDAYQMLQANLKFISDKKVRTIAVASSVALEGKSEVSANLAAALANAGRRVLIVDTDMRQPRQHHLWGLINSTGLSNIIVGQEEFSSAVQSITTNLSVLTAGVQPPNPLALIDSQRMASLIDIFSQSYDYIIFDTPPLVGTADAAVLGKMLDGILLVVQPGIVDSASANAAKNLLKRSEANILGIVANAVNLKQEPSAYFHYSKPRIGQEVLDVEIVNKQRVYK
ncbi:capsular exopolysaccharide family protein [Calothrix sp. NIES-4071]|nr:capsular exopolysaccharide family protein [Calothrix sp. NIES-4071]BAZ55831.1 capsular exopolysaccharide family protein [Calothrix sp. NIES-4105]